MVASWMAIFLSVMAILPSSLALAMVYYFVSAAGLFLGLIGAAGYVHGKNQSRD